MGRNIIDSYAPKKKVVATTKAAPANKGAPLMSTALHSMTSPYAGGAGSMFKPIGTDQGYGTSRNVETGAWGYTQTPMPTYDLPPAGQPPGGPGGNGRGGGGGGGAPAPDVNGMLALMNRSPQSYNWKDLEFNEYQPTAYRQFDDAKWDTLRSGLTDAISADRSAGNAQYAQLGQEMAAYQDPWSQPNTIQNPQLSAAMQRMMQANGTPTNINQADTNYGVQADQAFGNLGSILSLANQQDQASRLRSNQGYQRNLNERLDAEQRGGNLAVNMGEAQARELYEQEKWQFGEQIAQMNYQARTQNQQYNNTGQNQTSQQNTQMANEFNSGNIDQLLALLSQGVKVDPNALQNYVAPTGA